MKQNRSVSRWFSVTSKTESKQRAGWRKNDDILSFDEPKNRKVNLKIMIQEHVILVDPNGREIGTEEKIQAHREGKLHRAFSIFVFNTLDEVLLQKRAETKYHSGGLWTNACCSHPRPGENHHHAAKRRLHEEMGFDCELKELFSFIYHVKLSDDLFEHELDRVFVGRYDGQPTPNPDEVDDWKWVGIGILKQDIQENPQNYTHWFKLVLDRVIKQYDSVRYHDEV